MKTVLFWNFMSDVIVLLHLFQWPLPQLPCSRYRSNEMWNDALRVAKFHGGQSAYKRVAYAWALALGGDAGTKLLSKQVIFWTRERRRGGTLALLKHRPSAVGSIDLETVDLRINSSTHEYVPPGCLALESRDSTSAPPAGDRECLLLVSIPSRISSIIGLLGRQA